MGEKERAFVAEFKRLLDEKNVVGMFGLASTQEITLRAHVRLPCSQLILNKSRKMYINLPLN